MFEFITSLFQNSKKKRMEELKQKRTSVPVLPQIDPRRPLVAPDEGESAILSAVLSLATEQEGKILRSCAVCKFASHDETLGDRKEIICTLDPNQPKLKDSDDTCLKHELKYKGLKIIADKGTLLEYDSEKAFSIKGDKIPDTAISNIGEEEWQAK